MSDLAQITETFDAWDWACVVVNLIAAFAGIFALKCWHGLPGRDEPAPMSAPQAGLAVVTSLLSFGLIFGVVTGLAAQSFAGLFGFTQTHLFTAAFIGQSTAAGAMLALGLVAPGTLQWAPSLRLGDDPPPRTTWSLAAGRLGLILLGLFALGFALTLVWKGLHLGWEELAARGLLGEAPPDEPQDIIDSVLKTDVASWRFGTIVLAVVVGAPIMEELAFRGLLYPGLRRLGTAARILHGRWFAVLATGVLFSVAHQSFSAALPLFAFGAFMCLVRDRYGLPTCMAAHAAFNLWNLVWLKLAPNAATL